MRDIPLIKFISLAAPYGIVVAMLYLFGFWGAFHLNFIEFLSLADLTMLAVYPLATFLFSVIIGFTVSQLLPPQLPLGGGSDTRVGRVGRRYWQFFVAADIIIVLLIVVFGPNPTKWFFAAFLLALPSVIFTHIELFIELIPNAKARSNIFFLLFLIPGLAFAYGRLESSDIIKGNATYLVDVQASNLALGTSASEPVSYVGYISGSYVLFDNAQQRVFFVNRNARELFVLKPNPDHT